MLFSSISFLYLFLPLAILLYFGAGICGVKAQNLVLLLASLIFYGWGEPRYVLIMLAEIVAGYIFGFLIEKHHGKALGKIFLGASLVFDLGLLGYFKYVDFFITSFGQVTGISVKLLGVVLPIGISFYTFQMISYCVDVYRGNVKAQKNLITLATYVAMFPQLIAGPIVRYHDIEKQLTMRSHSFDRAALGVRRFVLGLGKKVLIANALGELCNTFRGTEDASVLYYWLYAVAFTLHIYFDFSGYSDMAIGLGKIFGFDFLENFNYPYISKSISEFWRRWHMSLGGWFRDYVYIPLGGNRTTTVKWLRNILIVWFLTGFWHGAAWNFIAWGLYYGILLLLEKPLLQRIPPAVGHVYVILLTLFGFVLFNADSVSQALWDIGGMFGFSEAGRLSLVSDEALYYLKSYAVVLLAGCLGATPLPGRIWAKLSRGKTIGGILTVLEPAGLFLLVLVVTAYLVDGSFNPFLYFRF